MLVYYANCLLFTSDNLGIKWYGKFTKWITVIGDPSDTYLTNMLTSLSGKAADCQDETPKNCELSDVDEGKRNDCSSLESKPTQIKTSTLAVLVWENKLQVIKAKQLIKLHPCLQIRLIELIKLKPKSRILSLNLWTKF